MIATGWIYIKLKDQWHFFAGGRSLCRKFTVVKTGKNKLTDRDDNDPENCADCKERLQTIREAQIKKTLN